MMSESSFVGEYNQTIDCKRQIVCSYREIRIKKENHDSAVYTEQVCRERACIYRFVL
jgi:hypothetical protein